VRKYWLLDYRPTAPEDSVEKAMEGLSKRYKERFIFTEYKWRREW